MERLTFEGNFCDIAQCRDSACRQDGTCTQKEVWKRLKAYEDTGLSPEKVSWMKEVVEAAFDNDTSRIERAHNLHVADKEGRCVVLPCKVGETVYFVNAKQILGFAVVGYAVDETGISWVHSEHVDKIGNTNERTFSPDRFGKNTFFAREEAEKALQEMEGKKDG